MPMSDAVAEKDVFVVTPRSLNIGPYESPAILDRTVRAERIHLSESAAEFSSQAMHLPQPRI